MDYWLATLLATTKPLANGRRPSKSNRRKTVDQYAAEHPDFVSHNIVSDGQMLQVLVCRYCYIKVGARSDRIKEHMTSKRHQQNRQDPSTNGTPTNSTVGEIRSQITLPNPVPDLNASPVISTGDVPSMPSCSSKYSCQSDNEASSVNHQEQIMTDNPPTPETRFWVRWDNFGSNIAKMFSKFRQSGQFVDVTISCENKMIKCHKIMLSAASTYFENILKNNPQSYVIIPLWELRYGAVMAVVEFIYSGDVVVPQGQLASFLKAAEFLEIRGLIRSESGTHPLDNNNDNFTDEDPVDLSTPIDYSSQKNLSISYTSTSGSGEGRPTKWKC